MPKPPKLTDLEARIKSATGASMASMLPESKEDRRQRKKEEKELAEKESVPLIEDVIENAALRMKIRKLTKAIYDLNVAEKAVKAQKEPLLLALKEILKAENVGEGKFMADEVQVMQYSVSRSTIVGTKLLENGVSPLIIEKSTTRTFSLNTRISMPGDKDDE